MPDGPTIGSANVEIRPDTATFEARLVSAIGTAVAAAQGKSTITPHVKTGEAELAIKQLGERMVKVAEYAGIYEAASKAKDIVGSAIGDAESTELLKSRAKSIFGPADAAVQAFVEKNHAAFFLTTNEAEQSAVNIGNAFHNIGLSAADTAHYSESLTQLAGGLKALHPGDITDVGTAVDLLTRAVESGSTRGLQKYGVHLSEADIKAEALALHLTNVKGNTDQITIAQNEAALTARALAKAQGGDPAGQQKVADATQRLADARNKAGDAHSRYVAGDYRVKAADEAVARAAESLASTQRASLPDQDAILSATDANIKAQDNLAKATGDVADITDQTVRSKAIAALLDKQNVNVQAQLGDASNSAAIAQAKNDEARKESLETFGEAILPTVKRGLDSLTSFLNDHQSQIKTFGDDTADALTKVGDGVAYIGEHQTAFEAFGGTIAAIFAVDKGAGAIDKLAGIITDAQKLGPGGLFGKLFPNIGKALNLGPTTITTPSVTVNAASEVGGGVGGTAAKDASAAEGAAVGGSGIPLLGKALAGGATATGATVLAGGLIFSSDAGPTKPTDQYDPKKAAEQKATLDDLFGHSANQVTDPGALFDLQRAALADTGSAAYAALKSFARANPGALNDTLDSYAEGNRDANGPEGTAQLRKEIEDIFRTAKSDFGGTNGQAAGNFAPVPSAAAGGVHIDSLTINNPTSDVDVIDALSRASHSNALTLVRKVPLPAESQRPVSSTLRVF